MLSTRFARRAKAAALTTLLAGGTLFGSSCTSSDIHKNLVAGTLGYVKSSATSFWSNLIPMNDMWAGLFSPTPKF